MSDLILNSPASQAENASSILVARSKAFHLEHFNGSSESGGVSSSDHDRAEHSPVRFARVEQGLIR